MTANKQIPAMKPTAQTGNLKLTPRWERFFALFVLASLSGVVILYFRILQSPLALRDFVFPGILIVLFISRAIVSIHEGLHIVCALWLNVSPTVIRAKGTHTYFDRIPKTVWIKATLFPLLLPGLMLILLAPFDLNWAFMTALIVLAGSADDLASAATVWGIPETTIVDTEKGLFGIPD